MRVYNFWSRVKLSVESKRKSLNKVTLQNNMNHSMLNEFIDIRLTYSATLESDRRTAQLYGECCWWWIVPTAINISIKYFHVFIYNWKWIQTLFSILHTVEWEIPNHRALRHAFELGCSSTDCKTSSIGVVHIDQLPSLL